MATNAARYVGNMILDPDGSKGPLVVPGLVQAGATQAIKRGELLERTAATNTTFVPMDSDYDMTGTSDALAIAAEEIKDGDRAGFYKVIAPRPGDLFRFKLLSSDAQNPAIGTAVYWSDSETVTTTAGTNILGHVAGFDHYPMQGHTADDASGDAGTTLSNVNGGTVVITIERSNSYYQLFQGE